MNLFTSKHQYDAYIKLRVSWEDLDQAGNPHSLSVFTIYSEGGLTGIKTMTQIDDAVYPNLVELELYVREK